jgi:hypothetical protein
MEKNEMKDWTEPNGIFILNTPINWQYRNTVVEGYKNESPYSFEPYENSLGCFQISCYPLKGESVNPNMKIQKNNSILEWYPTEKNDNEFNVTIYYAQVDDQLLFAKYIYSLGAEKKNGFNDQLKIVQNVLKSVRVIPKEEREFAQKLNKYDNFIGSLGASYDLLTKSIESETYIESIVILSNQIDAFLRLNIILETQLLNKTNDIEIKYLYQGESERGMIERKIYVKAFEMKIIDEKLYEQLNNLYNKRNRVIHRYIISELRTREILKYFKEYLFLCEEIRLNLEKYEEKQYEQEFGLYGEYLGHLEKLDGKERERMFAFANDKHLLKKFKRKI